MITKKLLKNKILAIREQLTKETIEKNSDKIFNSIFGLECYKNAKNIFIYNSFNNEVITKKAIKKMLTEKNVYLPKINFNDNMTCVKINEDTRYYLNRYNITEPFGVEEDKSIIDLCIVPGVVFDKFGGRTGYGKAYYDMFLRGTKIYKLAVCFDFQLLDFIPVDLLDVNMDAIVTEEKVLIINERTR